MVMPFLCWITQTNNTIRLHGIDKRGAHHIMPAADADMRRHTRARLAGAILNGEIDDLVLERVARIKAALETAGPPIEHTRRERIDGSPIMEGT